jgi:hypothetical protein
MTDLISATEQEGIAADPAAVRSIAQHLRIIGPSGGYRK